MAGRRQDEIATAASRAVMALTWLRKFSRALGRAFTSFGLIVIVLIAWQLLTVFYRDPYFPQPTKIATNTFNMLFRPRNPSVGWPDVIPFLLRMVSGYVIGSTIGVLIGMSIGLKRAVGDMASPVIEFLRSIPATATLPIFIVVLGGDDGMRVAFIMFGLTWYVIINTASGVSTVDQVMLDMAKAFKVSRMKTLFQVIFPAALPKIFAGLRIALTAAMLLAVVSEFFLVSNGIGFQLIQSQNRFNFLNMWSWMLVLAILGLLLNTLLEVVERRVLRWHRESHAR